MFKHEKNELFLFGTWLEKLIFLEYIQNNSTKNNFYKGLPAAVLAASSSRVCWLARLSIIWMPFSAQGRDLSAPAGANSCRD